MKITSEDTKKVLSNRGSYYLIVMNFFPIIGVIFWGWDPIALVFIYIAETIVIGIFNFFKIMMSQSNFPGKTGKKIEIPFWGKLFIGGFFLIHFNAFNYGQIELFTSFSGRGSGSLELFLSYFFSEDPIIIALLIIIISHFFSFYTDFIKGRQYETVPPIIFMFLPYPRIFVQQFVGIFGAFFVLLLNLPIMFLILLQVFKTLAELFSHTFINEKLEKMLNARGNTQEQREIINQMFKKNPTSIFKAHEEG